MTDRRRTAIHEAAHAVAEIVTGGTVELASIRPGRTFAGIEVPGRRERPGVDAFDPLLPVSSQPPALRASVERSIIVSLAGDIAEAVLYQPPTDPGPQPEYSASVRSDVPDTDEIARQALTSLGPRLAELVVALEESDEPRADDETNAASLADAVAGPALAGALYLEWLRVEARALVLRYQAPILRVADALERHAVLRGEQVAALVHPERSKSMSPRGPKPPTTPLAVCIEGHTSDLGTFKTGDRLRSSHPDVVRSALYWVDDGLGTEEMHELRQQRFYAAGEAAFAASEAAAAASAASAASAARKGSQP